MTVAGSAIGIHQALNVKEADDSLVVEDELDEEEIDEAEGEEANNEELSIPIYHQGFDISSFGG